MKRAVVALLAVGLTVSCEKKEVPPAAPPRAIFAVAETKTVPLTIRTFGNCKTIASVTLQAQVTGTLTRFAVGQGALVKAGDLVAEIDPAVYQAAVQQAQGNLDAARANLANMQVTLARQKKLYETKTIDLADLQTAEANELSAQGQVLTAEGDLADAQINLGYCTIKSPVDGKTGLYLVDAGNLVTEDQTEFINIQTLDPIYVTFTIAENDFALVRRYFGKDGLIVRANVPGRDESHELEGRLTFLNNAIDKQTGTLMLEATFNNGEGILWPGLFVEVELILTNLENAVVVPSSSVMIGQDGAFVFVLKEDDTTEQRPVTPGQRHGDLTMIEKGVAAGERVVTSGQLGLATGFKVTPVAASPAATK